MATLVARPVRTRTADDIFFTTMSVLMLVMVVVGFAQTYFLRGAMFAKLPSLLVHLHGAVFSSWIILFVVQSSLVAAGNVRLHRKLGVLGAVIAGLMVVLGVLAPFGTLRRGAVLPSFFTPTSFLIDNVIGILVFGAFVAVAIWKRNDRKVHKRILLIANCMLLPPALSRIPIVIGHYPFLIPGIPLGIIAALFVFDLFTWRKPLLVTVVGAVLFLVTPPISSAVDRTEFAHGLTVWAQHHP
ncbi:hypothetical protein [Granulicella sibirica]|uniref:Uncharacterized protein n=1 Tax=Granulicella sibirica TaxID=2479048 RepID=A0A4Q0T087_9BACT|nr:hypothetical protein [Granulicella sibirica]RXH55348.1 hypothetical protein GRAN_4452 [Granulicella sibirica]